MSILELSTNSAGIGSSSLLKYLPGLEALLETAQYTVACPNGNTLVKARDHSSDINSGVEYVVFDSDKSFETQELQDQKFDVILAFDLANATKHPDITLRNARNLLKEGGDICVLDVSKPGLYLSMLTGSGGSVYAYIPCLSCDETDKLCYRNNSLTPMLPKHGLKSYLALGDIGNPRLSQAELLIIRAAVETRTSHDNEEIVIIQPTHVSAKVYTAGQQLSEVFAKYSYRTSFFSWGSDPSALKGKPCISLLELERPMLSDMNERDFEFLKIFITEAKRVFWIVGFDGPSSGMVSGLARVVRNEIPGVSFQTAHMNIVKSSCFERLSSTIARVFTSKTADDEFRIQDDMVSISRVEEDVVANKQVQALMPNAPDIIDMVPLGQAGGPLKLRIQTPGMLDSLCFEGDDLPLTELEADQIEIDVKATALK